MPITAIPTFRELVLHGSAAALKQLFQRLPQFLPSAWQIDHVDYDTPAGATSEEGLYKVYQFEGSNNLPAANLWMLVDAEKAQVVNIVSPTQFELGYERYNAILASFANAVTKTLSETGIGVETAPWHEPTLEEVLQPEPAMLFKKFAKVANPTTGTMHPADGERWQDFLISAHQHHVEPNEELLRQWLKAECHWPEQTIDHTIEELQAGLDLLRKYEQTLPRSAYGKAA